ncbi:diguanylate cyclase domain-containing protein [Pseudohongiella nitratireducens]|mgnify:CR=1 FL=1|uniref:diguanylate cyclase domain-containing protein n=1 Tax=Pseudohongiella nitratireducens TaxID=1768907 RepID=UPI0030ECE914|tara:strand:- start:4902 stop:5747 length:846 start_codon:yes stop_codon:yes gene_type:complete
MNDTLKEILNDVIDLMLDPVFLVDKHGVILYVSSAVERILGYQPQEMTGNYILDFVVPDDREATLKTAESVIDGRIHANFENRYQHKDGHVVNLLWSARWIDNHQVRIGVARDITERKRAEERLYHFANHDPLTNLPNRLLFHDRVTRAIEHAKRYHSKLALLYLDLNGFKLVNDKHGHSAGDQFLQEMSVRLSSNIRNADTIARIGGDEFAVLLTGIADHDSVSEAILKIRKLIEMPIEINEHLLSVTASIGFALFPEQGDAFDELLHQADTSMYRTKRQ